MLRSKFWTGLKNTQLRSATRHKYDSLSDFQTLLKEIRQIEVEEQNLVKSKDPKPRTAQQHQASASASSEKFRNEEIYKQLCQLKSQLYKLEHKMSYEKRVHQEKPSESYQDNSQGGYDNFRGRVEVSDRSDVELEVADLDKAFAEGEAITIKVLLILMIQKIHSQKVNLLCRGTD